MNNNKIEMSQEKKLILPKNVKIYMNESGDLYLVNTWTGKTKVFQKIDEYRRKSHGTKYIGQKDIKEDDGDIVDYSGYDHYYGWWNGFKKVEFENDPEFYEEVQK